MTHHQQPVLVYNRIDQNRRNTVALLAFVPLLLLPFAAGIVVYMLPWLLLVIGPQLALSAGLSHQLLIEHPLAFEVLATVTAAAIVLGIMMAETLWNIWLYRTAMLRVTGAMPLSREKEPDLWGIVENLCIGAGLPLPRLYLVDSPVPNAFATGTDPAHASLGITHGLLELLDRRELEGVIAHELSHIGNQDTRLSTAVAGVIASLRLPIGIVTGIYRALGGFRLGLGPAFLLVFFGFLCLISAMSAASMDYLSSFEVPRWVLWRQVFVTVAPWYVLFGRRVVGSKNVQRRAGGGASLHRGSVANGYSMVGHDFSVSPIDAGAHRAVVQNGQRDPRIDVAGRGQDRSDGGSAGCLRCLARLGGIPETADSCARLDAERQDIRIGRWHLDSAPQSRRHASIREGRRMVECAR